MVRRKAEEVTGQPYPTAKRYKPSTTEKGFIRLQVTLSDSAFDSLRSSAIENNRSLSMEARTMIEAAIKASKSR